MLDDATYRIWTKEFNSGSYYEGSWDKGSEILFLTRTDKGSLEGMYSRIQENIPFEFISVIHLGIISDGVVDTTSEQVKKWAPAFENYSFTEEGGMTRLSIEMQVEPEYKKIFEEMWPRALAALQSLCESK